MNHFTGKVVIVKGAAQGIGLAICQSFVAEGASVVMCDIDLETCNNESHKLCSSGDVA